MGRAQTGQGISLEVIERDSAERTAAFRAVAPPLFTNYPDGSWRCGSRSLLWGHMPGGAQAWGRDHVWKPEPASVAEARAWTHWVLCDWQLTWLLNDARFCVSELVTNSVVHAKSPYADAGVTLRMWFWPNEALVVEVLDEDPRLPRMPGPEVLDASAFAVRDLSDCHRGLLTVAACTDLLLWERTDWGGKSVWCRFWLDAASRRRRSG